MLDADNFRPASSSSFGALGGTACLVFSDPERNLTAALHFNGNTGFADRITRDQRVVSALYDDLDHSAE